MHQAQLQLDIAPQHGPALATARPSSPSAAAVDDDAIQRDGFDIGWDHAHHALVPPIEHLLPGTPVAQGWMAGRAVFGKRTLASTVHTRQWLQLRLLAWCQGVPFERQLLTPNYLAQLQTGLCPVTRKPLHGAPSQPETLVFERLNPDAAYAAGNLAALSQTAASAWAGLSVADCTRRARQAQDANAAARWWRLAALRAMATPLPFAVAAGLPLAVLPPNRVRLLNAVQGLQALLTRSFASPGWADRCRTFASWLPNHSLRQDFNLFVGALAPRAMEAQGQGATALRHALEDAWLHERVQRRWQHLVLSVGEPLCATLLERATAAGLSGVRTLHLQPEQATDGWGLRPSSVDMA